MKIISMTALLLLVGCAHEPRYPMPRLTGSATEADANVIAQATVHAKEKWKRVDGVARPLDSGWSVFVCPIPAPVAGSYVLVTVDPAGQVTRYERARFTK
jgi:hypothetical protein